MKIDDTILWAIKRAKPKPTAYPEEYKGNFPSLDEFLTRFFHENNVPQPQYEVEQEDGSSRVLFYKKGLVEYVLVADCEMSRHLSMGKDSLREPRYATYTLHGILHNKPLACKAGLTYSEEYSYDVFKKGAGLKPIKEPECTAFRHDLEQYWFLVDSLKE